MSGKCYYKDDGPDVLFEIVGLSDANKEDLKLWRVENAVPAPVHHLQFDKEGILSKCEIIYPTSIPIWFVTDSIGFFTVFNYEMDAFDSELPSVGGRVFPSIPYDKFCEKICEIVSRKSCSKS